VDRPGFGRAIVGRGAVKQKGPEGTLLAALHALRAAKVKLPVNLVLVAEGQEEIGSLRFHQIVRRPDIMAALGKAEGIFPPVGWQDINGNAEVNLGAKGVIEVGRVASGEHWGRGPKGDIHSSCKAMVDSPAWRLVEALQTLVTPDGNTPAIDRWFENVRPPKPRGGAPARYLRAGAGRGAGSPVRSSAFITLPPGLRGSASMKRNRLGIL
jgi:acetylornithine deacetylase/succinyl-diaminopimelate desuccinylase-like protein